MPTGEGIVTKLTNISPIPGADFIVQCQVLGETIITQKDTPEGTLGILFDMETQLSPEFLRENNLYRHSELNKNPKVVGHFEDNGRVRPIRLRGVKCSAFFIPVDSLNYLGVKVKENDVIGSFGNEWVAKKYVSPRNQQSEGKVRKGELSRLKSHMFKLHFDTQHLMKSLHQLPEGDFVLTKKLHGTSARYGNLLVNRPLKWWERIYAKFFDYQPTAWANITGSRTVTKSLAKEPVHNTHYYSQDIWSKAAEEKFGNKLLKGETVFFEIVGYLPDGGTIMPSSSTKVLNQFLDKAEYKQVQETYGDVIEYTYGLARGFYDVYVYRITHTTVDGDSFDLSWDQVKQRCEKLGVNHVPEVLRGYIKVTDNTKWFITENEMIDIRSTADWIELQALEAHHNGTHAEGVCLRMERYPICEIYKHKNVRFKVMEHGIKSAGIGDIEEQQETPAN